MVTQLLFIFGIICLLGLINFSRERISTLAVFWILCVVLVVFTGLRDGTKVTDYSSYEILFSSGITTIEPTFILITNIVKNFLRGDIVTLMCVYALLTIPLKFLAIQRYSEFIFVSLVIWIGNLFLQQDFTQVRAAAATSVFLLSLNSLYHRDKRYWLYVLVAVSFHFSSVLLVPLWFLSSQQINKKFWMAAFFTAYIFGILRIDIINVIGWISPGFIHDKYLMYRASQEMQAGGYQVNIFSLLFMARAALWCILLWKSDLLFKNNKYALILLKIMALSLISMLVFSTNIAFALRTMEFYGIVEILLFPMLIYLFRQKIVPRIALVCFATIAIYSRIFIFELILN